MQVSPLPLKKSASSRTCQVLHMCSPPVLPRGNVSTGCHNSSIRSADQIPERKSASNRTSATVPLLWRSGVPAGKQQHEQCRSHPPKVVSIRQNSSPLVIAQLLYLGAVLARQHNIELSERYFRQDICLSVHKGCMLHKNW